MTTSNMTTTSTNCEKTKIEKENLRFNSIWESILISIPSVNNYEHESRNIKAIIHRLVSAKSIDEKVIKKTFKVEYKLIKKEENGQNKFKECRVILFACVVKYLALTTQTYRDTELPQYELQENEKYLFESLRTREHQLLLEFQHYLRITLRFVPPRENKQLILGICGVLEGGGERYVTGGDERDETRRRVKMFEHEGKHKPVKRPERKMNKRKQSESDDSSCASPISSMGMNEWHLDTDFSEDDEFYCPTSRNCKSPKYYEYSHPNEVPANTLETTHYSDEDFDECLNALSEDDGDEPTSIPTVDITQCSGDDVVLTVPLPPAGSTVISTINALEHESLLDGFDDIAFNILDEMLVNANNNVVG